MHKPVLLKLSNKRVYQYRGYQSWTPGNLSGQAVVLLPLCQLCEKIKPEFQRHYKWNKFQSFQSFIVVPESQNTKSWDVEGR